jgi:hypothetical protein
VARTDRWKWRVERVRLNLSSVSTHRDWPRCTVASPHENRGGWRHGYNVWCHSHL